LYQEDIFTSPVVSPAVPRGRDMLRLAVTAAHTPAHLERLIAACHSAARALGMI